jgi:hypothetical protein
MISPEASAGHRGNSEEAMAEMAKFKRVWEKADEQLLTTSCKCIENLNK